MPNFGFMSLCSLSSFRTADVVMEVPVIIFDLVVWYEFLNSLFCFFTVETYPVYFSMESGVPCFGSSLR